jgi:anti-sigma regulatory factor (Ser/Thr protein kinase)
MMLAARLVDIGLPAYTMSFPRERASVRGARQLIADALAEWDLADGLGDSAALIVSELVTNSVEHARGSSMRLTVMRRLNGVRIGVVDLSRRLPAVQAGDNCGEHGRGLVIVDALATVWGTQPLPWGKRVWAHLDVP